MPVQLRDKSGANHQAYLWPYGQPGGETVFEFCLGRGREGPRKFLGQWEGLLQSDGDIAYDQIGGPGLVPIGCWAHARRKFVDAVKINPQVTPQSLAPLVGRKRVLAAQGHRIQRISGLKMR